MTSPVPLHVLVTEILAAIVALGLGLFIAFRGGSKTDRILSFLLLAEGLTQAGWSAGDLAIARGNVALADWFIAGAFATFAASGILYLLLLRTLETPLVTPLRSGWIVACLGVGLGATALLPMQWLLSHPGAFDVWAGVAPAPLIWRVAALAVPMAILSLYALVSSLSAWRRARTGTLMRSRAAAFALAFGARDLLYVAAIVLNVGIGLAMARSSMKGLTYPIWSIASLAFAVLLAYGILRTQLFDIDLKLKVGISRSAVVTIGLVAVLAAAKVVELYVSRSIGFVAGGIVAGALLVLAPRLNKLGDKVANVALPNVQPTPGYVQFKKLEVYKAAVESAQETGGIDERQRATLDRLRSKLGLAEADAEALESELRGVAA